MKQGKRILAGCLATILLLGLFPDWGGLIPTAQAANGTTIDAFGIQMTDWTAEEKAQAEGEAPIGVGYQTKTSLLTHAELYVSLGYDRDTRLTGVRDWNNQNRISDVTNGVTWYSNSGLYQEQAPYTFVETAAMDASNSGKDDYIASLAYNKKSNSIQLFVTTTDGDNKVVAGPVTVASGDSLKQMRDLDTYELRGAMTVAAGDFDGDGKDTIVVYLPTVDNGVNPVIYEYKIEDNSALVPSSSIAENVYSILGLDGALKDLDDHDLENQPMVSLVAEDIDKDGFDELVVTAGMNCVDTDNMNTSAKGRLGSQTFIYEWVGSKWNQTFHMDLNTDPNGTADGNGRIVWASSTVGNLNISTDISTADYMEILSAGFVDSGWPDNNGQVIPWMILVEEASKIGVVGIRVNPQDPIKESKPVQVGEVTAQNQICNYEVYIRQKVDANGFTRGGFYGLIDETNSLLQVQAFADKGYKERDSVFIAGSVYQMDQDRLSLSYTPEYFKGADRWANRTQLTNTNVQSVVAGNFDGNSEGKEQLIFVTSLRQSGKNNSYSQMWYIYNGAGADAKGNDWKSNHSDYLVSHKGAFYMTLNAVDPDNDSPVVTLEGVTRTYSQPDVMAILEAPPYFEEMGKTGNGKTAYGTNQSSGSTGGQSFAYSSGLSVGWDWTIPGMDTGTGVDFTIKNSLNYGSSTSQKRTWSIEYSNDSGQNAVVVYRCPVVSYLYKDQNDKSIIINKNGMPITSVIPVEDYNKAAKEYKLSEITDAVVDLGEPGNPSSYRSSITGLTNVILGDQTTGTQTSPDGWVQYAGQGTVQQSLSLSKDQSRVYTYALDLSLSAWGKSFGFKFGDSEGFQYTKSSSTLDGTGVSKSGSVVSKKAEGYDFQWKFATWQAKVNANTVPVLGFLVQDVVAPPSPAQNLTVDTVSQDSVTLSWNIGDRPAQQYRIYRVLEETGTPYVLVGATDGTATSYTLTDLQPGDTYTYVVRGVGYDDEGNAKVSVDSSPVTVRTTSATAADVTITLSGVDEEGVLHSSGDSASITANVYNPTPSASVSYQWQIRTPGNAQWTNLTNIKDAKDANIKNVSGATSSSLTLGTIKAALNGGALRCVVTVSSKDGTPEYYYSPIATLNLSGSQTVTHITVVGAAEGTGDLESPYVAQSGYTTNIEKVQEIMVKTPVTVEADGVSYTVYSAGQDGQTKYVGIAFVDGQPQYVSVTNSGETYTVGDPLTASEIQYHYLNSEGKDTVYEGDLQGFDGYATETVTEGEKTYLRVYQFSGGDSNAPKTEYWYSLEDEKYYTRSGDEGTGYTYTLPEEQPTGDLRTVYYSKAENLIITDPVDKVEREKPDETETGGAGTGGTGTTETPETETVDPSEGYEKYEVYRLDNSGAYRFNTVIWAVGDSTLYQDSPAAQYADRSALSMEFQDGTVTKTTTSIQHTDGTELTLTAGVTLAEQPDKKVDTTVDFIITDTDTGSKTTLVASSNSPVTWRAPAAGLYRITATARVSKSTIASSSSCYYYARAVDTTGSTTEYRLLAQQNGSQVTEIAYNGQPVTLTLQSRAAARADGTPGAWSDVEEGVSFTVNGQAISGDVCTPDAAGAYDFIASVDGTQVATARLEISKLSLTLAPMWEGMEQSNVNSAPQYLSDIQIRVTGTMVDQDEALLSQALAVSCALYDENGENQNVTGAYDVNLVWTTDDAGALTEAARKIQSRYEVTLEQETLYSMSGSVVVSFRSGENGSLSAMYRDESQTELPIVSSTGTSIPNEYSVIFTATPHSGYVVDQWTVNGQVVTDGVVSYPGGGQTLSLALGNYKDVGNVAVEVSFANSDNTIQFTSDANGSLTAADGSGNQLSSGSSVAFGASVTFTAAPAEGYMVDHWTVDNVAYVWPGTREDYRQSTLTLENLSAGHHVAVFFAPEAYTQVSGSVVNTAGQPSSAATLTLTDTDGQVMQPENGSYRVRQDASLVFTASAAAGDSNTTVREWQTSTDGVAWTTVTGSGGQPSLTIHNPAGENLYVRAVVDVAQSFDLDWKIQMSGTGAVPEDAAITAVSNGVTLTAGAAQPAYVPVDFTLALSDAYYVVGWSDNVDSAGKTARLESLTADTTVIVTIAKKPVVTIDSLEGGTVRVTGTVNGRPDQVINSGDYVDLGSDLTVTLYPNRNYEVGPLDGIDAAYTDGTGSTTDDKTYSIQNVQSDLTVAQPWAALPLYNVTYAAVDAASGEAGTGHAALTASVERKGMEIYQQDAFAGGAVAQGSTITFTARPEEGCWIQGWQINGELWPAVGTSQVVRLENPTADTDVAVIIAKKPVVTIDSLEGGTVQVTGTVNGRPNQVISSGDYVDFGSDLTVTLYPDKNYEVGPLDGIDAAYTDGTGSTTDNKTYSIQNVQSDLTVAQPWAALPLYNVTYAVVDTTGGEAGGGHGTLTASAERKGMDAYRQDAFAGGTVAQGSTVTFTAQPEEGYRIQEWRVNGALWQMDGTDYIGTTLTLERIDADTEVTVQFAEVGNKLTVSAGNHGGIASAMVGSTDQVNNIESGFTLVPGASVTITAQPDPGYEVDQWVINGSAVEGASGDTFTYTAETDQSGAAIAVTFRQVTYAVSWEGSHGTVTVQGYEENSAQIRGGEQLVFTAVPDQGYTVTGWTVNGQEVTQGLSGNTLTWTVPNGQAADPVVTGYEIRAIFESGSYEVVIQQPDHAVITASQADLDAVAGDTEITFTAEPEEGYQVAGWIVNGQTTDSSSATYSIQIKENTTISAVIVPSAYLVTYGPNDPAWGSVTAAGAAASPASVGYGQSITFTAQPSAFYYIAGWQLDGVLVENTANQAAFTLTDVKQAHTVTAVFAAAISFEVGYESGANGSLSATVNGEPLVLTPDQYQNVWGGSKLVFTAQPSTSAYMLAGWEVSTDGGRNYTAVTRDNMAAFGISMSHPLATVLTVDNLGSSLKVRASYQAYVGYTLPTGGADYTVQVDSLSPSDTQPEDQVRQGGDVRFTVAPVAGKTLSQLTVNGTDCLTTAAAQGESNRLSVVTNGDGSYTITIENVQRQIDLEVSVADEQIPSGGGSSGGGSVAASYQISVTESDRGQITVSKSSAATGSEITVTVLPDEGYLLAGVTVAGADGKALSLTEKGEGKYTFTMPEYDVVVAAQFRCDGGDLCPSAAFEDLDTGAWYHEGVDYAIEQGLMTGVGGNRFDPDGVLNRAMLVTMLWRMEQAPQCDFAMTFADVEDGAWYTEAVRWAASEGIVTGFSQSNFGPDDTVTREQLATILYRYARYKDLDTAAGGDLSAFSDAGEAGDYAVSALIWAVERGLVNGVGGNTLLPQGSATRSQAAAMLMRFAEYAAQ